MTRKVIPNFSKRRAHAKLGLKKGLSHKRGSSAKGKYICAVCGCELTKYNHYNSYDVIKSYTHYSSEGILYVNICKDAYSCQRNYLKRLEDREHE